MKSIRTRMLLVFGLSLSALFLVLSVSFYNNAKNIIMDLTIEQCSEIVRARADEISMLVSGYSHEIIALSMLDIYRSGNIEMIKREIVTLGTKTDTDFFSVFFCDLRGYAYTSQKKTVFVGDRDYYNAVMKNNVESFISHPVISRASGEKVVYIAAPVYGYNNKKTGVIAVSIKLERLSEIAGKINLGNHGYGWIIDEEGLMVAHPNRDYPMKFNVFDSKTHGYTDDRSIEVLSKQKAGVASIVDPYGVKLILLFDTIPASPGWKFGISIPENGLTRKVDRLIISSLILAAISMVLLVLIIFSMSYYISTPIKKLSGNMAEVANGNLDLEVQIESSDEIGLANKSFIEMLNKLKEARETILKYTNNLETIVDERTAELKASNEELRKALATVKTLSGFLPICASCKKIRDDKGYWEQIEQYIHDHSNVEFSHGLCPDCASRLYGNDLQKS